MVPLMNSAYNINLYKGQLLKGHILRLPWMDNMSFAMSFYLWYTSTDSYILTNNFFYRCEIPVIIMGETGCGKTRLIKFMCALQQPRGVTVENMILIKVWYFYTNITKYSKMIRNCLLRPYIESVEAILFSLCPSVCQSTIF